MDSRRLNRPISDAKVFKESRHNSLPQRSIFDVEIVDSCTGISQVLDSLQKRSGPLVFKGLVPLEETKHSTGVKDSLLYIYGEIIEWTHQYNSTHPKRPIFWLKSDGVGWYKIESVTRQYEPYFAPLEKVCSYLDVLVQLVVEMKIKDDMRELVPQVAVLFAEPESKVERMLELHRKQLLDLGASDSIIRGSNFYKKWVLEHASEAARSLQRQSSRNSIDTTRPVHSDTFTNDVTTITDSDDELSNNHGSPSCHQHYNLHEIDNNDFNDTPQPPVARKPPKFYDMADRDIIPILEADVENYEELSAPCGDDICYRHPEFCPLHSVHRTFPHNAISDDIELLYSKFGPELEPAVKIEPGLESCSGPGDGSRRWGTLKASDPGCFYCPVDDCLITLSNAIFPTFEGFIAAVSQHVGTHDLSQGDTERVLREYLTKPWKPPVRPKAWDVTARQLNTQHPTPTLNLHVYWMLNSKKNPDNKATTHVPSITSARSSRKRATSQTAMQATPSSSSTSSPRSTPTIRQPLGVARSSMEHSLEAAEVISTTPRQHPANGAPTSTMESTRIYDVQKTITTSSVDVLSRGSSSPDRARYRRQDRESSSNSTVNRRGRSKRRADSNETNISDEEINRPERKLQRRSQRLPSDESEGDEDLKMRIQKTPYGRSVSRGRAATSTNETQLLRRSSRSMSRGRVTASSNEKQPLRRSSRSKSRARITPSANVNRTPNLRQSTPVAMNANETLYMQWGHDRSRSGTRNDIEQFNLDMDYEDDLTGPVSDVDVDDSGLPFYYSNTWERDRSRSRSGGGLEMVKGDGLVNKQYSIYRVSKHSEVVEPVFMRCYHCDALTYSSDGHPRCRELAMGSENNPVVLP